MAEPDFERRLERLFAEPPALADADAFAARFERRLARGWTARRWALGAAGVAGGLVGASQLLFSGVFARVREAESSARAVSASLTFETPSHWLSLLPSDAAVVWTAVGVAVVLAGFVLTRVIEEI